VSILKYFAIAVTIGIGCTATLFGINFLLTKIPPEHYRNVTAAAVADGTLATSGRYVLAPEVVVDRFGGNDCLILTMLMMPRESPSRAAISPRMPLLPQQAHNTHFSGYPRGAHCRDLAAIMTGRKDGPISEQPPLLYYHRYLHGDVTLAALLLARLSVHAASQFLLGACYALVLALAFAAAVRLRRADPAEQFRARSFLAIAAVLAFFYGLTQFGRSFSFAPTDIVIGGFLLFSLCYPLGELSERAFVVVVSLFAAGIAVFEFLTGGIPLALAILVAIIALGHRGERVSYRRLAIGLASFAAALAACFATKLAFVAGIWGTQELVDFFSVLQDRMVGPVVHRVPPALSEWMARHGLVAELVDANYVVRLALVGVMLTYSSFGLGWGSHAVGAAIVLIPLPVILVCMGGIWRLPLRDAVRRQEAMLLLAAVVPLLWYCGFTNHTFTHSSYMVRPLAFNFSLALILITICLDNRLQSRKA
jgi:hypothetical protein